MKTEINRQLVLTLDEDEAHMLRDMTQNPPKENQNESIKQREFREKLFIAADGITGRQR